MLRDLLSPHECKILHNEEGEDSEDSEDPFQKAYDLLGCSLVDAEESDECEETPDNGSNTDPGVIALDVPLTLDGQDWNISLSLQMQHA